jgi:hypothetical protein
MRKSLIDSIGRSTAYSLMEGAVLQAIEENQSSGLVNSAKTVQVVNGVLSIAGADGITPLVAGGAGPSARRALNKKVPIA